MSDKKVTKNGGVKLNLEYQQDSKRYHRYLISENNKGVVGTVYFSKDIEIPDQLILDVQETE